MSLLIIALFNLGSVDEATPDHPSLTIDLASSLLVVMILATAHYWPHLQKWTLRHFCSAYTYLGDDDDDDDNDDEIQSTARGNE